MKSSTVVIVVGLLLISAALGVEITHQIYKGRLEEAKAGEYTTIMSSQPGDAMEGDRVLTAEDQSGDKFLVVFALGPKGLQNITIHKLETVEELAAAYNKAYVNSPVIE